MFYAFGCLFLILKVVQIVAGGDPKLNIVLEKSGTLRISVSSQAAAIPDKLESIFDRIALEKVPLFGDWTELVEVRKISPGVVMSFEAKDGSFSKDLSQDVFFSSNEKSAYAILEDNQLNVVQIGSIAKEGDIVKVEVNLKIMKYKLELDITVDRDLYERYMIRYRNHSEAKEKLTVYMNDMLATAQLFFNQLSPKIELIAKRFQIETVDDIFAEAYPHSEQPGIDIRFRMHPRGGGGSSGKVCYTPSVIDVHCTDEQPEHAARIFAHELGHALGMPDLDAGCPNPSQDQGHLLTNAGGARDNDSWSECSKWCFASRIHFLNGINHTTLNPQYQAINCLLDTTAVEPPKEITPMEAWCDDQGHYDEVNDRYISAYYIDDQCFVIENRTSTCTKRQDGQLAVLSATHILRTESSYMAYLTTYKSVLVGLKYQRASTSEVPVDGWYWTETDGEKSCPAQPVTVVNGKNTPFGQYQECIDENGAARECENCLYLTSPRPTTDDRFFIMKPCDQTQMAKAVLKDQLLCQYSSVPKSCKTIGADEQQLIIAKQQTPVETLCDEQKKNGNFIDDNCIVIENRTSTCSQWKNGQLAQLRSMKYLNEMLEYMITKHTYNYILVGMKYHLAKTGEVDVDGWYWTKTNGEQSCPPKIATLENRDTNLTIGQFDCYKENDAETEQECCVYLRQPFNGRAAIVVTECNTKWPTAASNWQFCQYSDAPLSCENTDEGMQKLVAQVEFAT